MFTIPGQPFRTQVPDFQTFVSMMGGGYFFLPGIRAVEYLADKIPEPYNGPANAVFSGGAVKAIAFPGALEITESDKHKIEWKGIAGTSGGSIVAALLAAGYDSQNIFNFMCGGRVVSTRGATKGTELLPGGRNPNAVAGRRAL